MSQGFQELGWKNEQQALELARHVSRQEAETIYRRLIQQGTRNNVVFENLATICWTQGKTQEMIQLLNQALAIKPDDPDTLNNLGIALDEEGNVTAAIAAYEQALAIKPDDPDTLANLGISLNRQGNVAGAVAAYGKALTIKPDYADALSNLGMALHGQGNVTAAIAAYGKALTIKPHFPEALNNLGIALSRQGNVTSAVAAYGKALTIKPDYADALSNLGMALHGQGNFAAAINAYKTAIAFDKNHGNAHFNLALSLLLSGDYEGGWKEYEWRFSQGIIQPHAYPQVKHWNGHHLSSGERLILVSEQGLGDTLQFMRYVPYLSSMGMDVCLCAQKKLHDLMKTSGIITTICSPEEGNQICTGQWLPLLSLPGCLHVRPDNPLVQPPCIKAPRRRILHWKQKLSGDKRPIIGISWQGSPQAERGGLKGRSFPLAALAPVVETTGATLLSLQKGYGSEKLAGCCFKDRFVACQEEINRTWDFVETAALVMNCDLIITCDSAIAHLAGGLGQPTWLLLQAVPDWRWGMSGERTFWYPSMHLFRQRERGNWQQVMDRVASALEVFMTSQG